MANTSFNYATPAYQQHARHPGFWHYAQRIRSYHWRYEIRLDQATMRRAPIAA